METVIARIKELDWRDVVSVLFRIVILAVIAFIIFGIPGIIVATGNNYRTGSTVGGKLAEGAEIIGTTDYTVVERVVNAENDTLRLYCVNAEGKTAAFSVPYDSGLDVGDTVVETTYQIADGYWGLVLETFIISFGIGVILVIAFIFVGMALTW